MSAISLKSITGITSITTPAGVDNQLTLHNNNTSEAVKIDVAGNVHINNQLAVAGITTFSNHAYFSNNVRGIFGAGNRLQIVSNGTNSYFDYAGSLNVRGNSGSAAALSFLSNSNVLVSNNLEISKDLDVDGHTNLDNGNVSGIVTFNSGAALHMNGGQLLFYDRPDGNSNNLFFGTGGKAVIFHDGTNFSQVNNTGHFFLGQGVGNKDLMLYAQASGNVLLQQNTGVRYVKGVGSDASVQLFFNNNLKLNTTNTGINITGNTVADGLVIDGNSDLNGDLDVDGHTNLDNVSVAGVTTVTNNYFNLKPNGGGNAHLRILSTGTGDAGIFFDAANGDIAGSDYVFIGQQNNLDFVINANVNAGNIDFQRAGNTQVRITSAGTFGVGTVNPDSNYKIDCNGVMRIGDGNAGKRIQFSRSGLGDELVLGVDGYGSNFSANDAVIQSSPTFGRPLIFGTNNQERLRIDSSGKVLINSSTVTASYGGKLQVTNTNFAMNSFANNQHAQTLLFAKSRATSGSGGTIVGSGDFCGHIEWYADDGENTENQIAKISGQMDGSPGVNDTPGKLLFYTTVDGANASTLRMQISSGGVVHIGSTATSNTIPTGGLDLQGDNTNCIIEMGNPLPNYSAGRVPTFRIKTRDSDKAVDFSSMWGGDNGIWKHMTLAGGATIFYNGTNDTEIARITGSALMVGTTSSSSSTQAKGISLNNDGAMVSRRDGVMHYYKSISTGGYYANIFLSANTTVGSIYFNSGGTQFNTSSDYRRKENVVSLTDGISKLKQLKPYRFNFKDNPSETVDGFLAHEAQEIVPHTVTGTKDQVSTSNDVAVGIATTVGEPIYQQMDLSKLVPLLTAALQDEISKREALEARVAALESS